MKFLLTLFAIALIAHTAFAAGVGPVTDGLPAWASKNDMCLDMKSCDECDNEYQYCKYSADAVPQCCMRAAGSTPIELPKWASDKDICKAVAGGCDNCQSSQYCKYKSSGESLCCSRADEAVAPPADDSNAAPMAGVVPIAQSPIPSWASSNDVCVKTQTCDECDGVTNAYCKYTDAGHPACCIRPAGVVPIAENPVPTWASSKDVCKVIGTCDACEPNDNQYCSFTKDATANCCQRSADDTSAPMAGVLPITENPTPDWASDADLCVEIARGCDACNTTEYCKYTAEGAPTCCSRGVRTSTWNTPRVADESGDMAPSENAGVAGIVPVAENPIPTWASASDKCASISSCDACTSTRTQYCTYVKDQPTCCKSTDKSQPLIVAAY